MPEPFKRSHVHLLTTLAPLVIGELVKDPEKRWRYIRIASVIGAALGEVIEAKRDKNWRDRIQDERRFRTEDAPDQEQSERLQRARQRHSRSREPA